MKRDELSKTSAEMTGVIAGINATMATIEFTPDGTVVTANDNFLKSMEYTLDKIKGKHHRLFAPKEVLESEEYKTFWTKLASGEAITGIFKRISSSGKVVWLNAIYNPILNANGDVVKVIKFATDITLQQEMLAESSGVITGINTTMATIEFTPDGTVITANDNFLKSMGYTLDKIKGKHHKLFAPKEVIESEEYKTFWTRLASGAAIAGVFKRVSATGNNVWLNAIYNPILNANGDVVKVIKFATDVTKEKEAEIHQLLEESKAQEEELRQNMEELATTQEEINRRQKESEALLQRFELSAETTSDGLWDMVVPETLEFTNETPFFWTNKFRAMLGYKNEMDFPNILSSWSDLLHPDHKQITLSAFTAHLMDFSGKTPYDVEYKLKLHSGEYKWFRAIGKTLRDEKGKPMRVAGSLIDIQATKDLEQIRKDVVERFELTSSASTEGLWDMTVPENLEFKDDTSFSWTPKFREMLGYKNVTDFPNILASWSDLLHPDHKQKTLDAFTAHLIDFSGKTPYDVEYKLKLKTGDYKWFRAVGKTMRDVNGKPLRVAGALIDIQAIKELEELKKSKKS
jgi:PAS domain S-box-containing protein